MSSIGKNKEQYENDSKIKIKIKYYEVYLLFWVKIKLLQFEFQ